MSSQHPIELKNVTVHNLKNVSLKLIPHQLIVFTGVSGSGKSSLAFDTIYVEGQRRYIESLSTHARRQIGSLVKPEADLITGLSPTIAIEQKTVAKNPRSIVGTLTGIHDYLRVLFAKIATPYCPISLEPVTAQTQEQIIKKILNLSNGSKFILLAPLIKNKKGALKEELEDAIRKGFTRVRLDGNLVDLSEELDINPDASHDLEIVVDRFVLKKEEFTRITESILTALGIGKGLILLIDNESKEEHFFSEHAFSKSSGLSYPKLEPQNFSFNHPAGMCPQCQGLGISQEFDLSLILDEEKSISENCCILAGAYQTVKWGNIFDNLAELYHFDVKTPWKNLSKKAKEIYLYGSGEKWLRMKFVHPVKKNFWYDFIKWKGVIYEAKKRLQEASSDLYKENMAKLMKQAVCSSCHGSRLLPYPSAALFKNYKISNIQEMTIDDCYNFFSNLSLANEEKVIGEDLIKEIVKRLTFLKDVGLGYLSLSRSAPTLSGGEAQRVRLASHIGSGLVGATYVLDEPSIGLHPRDHTRLISTLKSLRDLGNTVIVVEHDDEMILEADTVVDVGPGAGRLGGEILSSGTLNDLLKNKRSITGKYLTGELCIEVPKKIREGFNKKLTIYQAAHHNLKNLTVSIPLERFVCVTGLSGSGKSSLILDVLYAKISNELHRSSLQEGSCQKIEGAEHINKVICIDQSPIGRTPRSNPATYIKVFDDIRDLFAKLKESQALGFTPGHFSFNVLEGSCATCKGAGQLKVDMDFLEEAWTPCTTCLGKRFDPKVLSITFKEKNIFDVLEMTIEDASAFFSSIPSIAHSLTTLKEVGLGYMQLGQSSTTLSGGEAQRIKLAKELLRPSTGRTLYILDEPTTGLHFHDISKLLTILHSLVNQNNSVIVIEHNMDFVKTADWVIDMGPDGGERGGQIISEGTPKEICELLTPTALALKKAYYRSYEEIFSHSKGKKKTTKAKEPKEIIIENVTQNNLKGVSLKIPQNKITVCTGPSGSGKSSLAFETIYAEGQRRYVESLSAYARQFVHQMPKAKVGKIEGLSPAIAIEQKHHAGNPRSTIGTMTEIYDYLRVLYATAGVAYCPVTLEKIESITKEFVTDQLTKLTNGTKLIFLSPLEIKKTTDFTSLKEKLQQDGFLRIRVSGTYYELDEEIPFNHKTHQSLYLVIDRILLKEGSFKRIFEAIDKSASLSKNQFIVEIDGKDHFYNLAFAVPSTGQSYPPITPHTFSFNTEEGMCLECSGLGVTYGLNLYEAKNILDLSPCEIIATLTKDRLNRSSYKLLMKLLELESIERNCLFRDLSPEALSIFLHGSDKIHQIQGRMMRWSGIYATFAILAKCGVSSLKKELAPFLKESVCPSCSGSRVNKLASNVKVAGRTIGSICHSSIDEVSDFLSSLELSKDQLYLLKETLEQLKYRLSFLQKIGVGYLSLSRSAPTLSGGETQRIFLARQLGSGLTGALYVLDEPSIGLHPYNNSLLNDSLIHLKTLGNTLVLVEHDPLTIEISDHIIDFGPKAGIYGGEVMAQGSLDSIKKNPNSLTGLYLSGKKTIPIPDKRRTSAKFLKVNNASIHNLKNISCSIPVGTLVCVTGVSGSGKSSLVFDVIEKEMKNWLLKDPLGAPHLSETDLFDKILSIDQNPIGHTSRADVSTYIDLLTPLRSFFAQLPEAAIRGLQPANFSYNHKKGMCKGCEGLGYKIIQLQFLPPVRVDCEICQGLRLNPLSLQVKYKDKTLGDILKLSLEEAKDFLPQISKIQKILQVLKDVGLEYLHLGQEIASLSGGEAQRLRLAKELSKRSTGKTLYLFDEPSIGLHWEDIKKLITIFQKLVTAGNTVIIVEHNIDIIAQADYILDLGPFGGSNGGELVASGSPEEITLCKKSLTGNYLKEHLDQLHYFSQASVVD